MTEPTNSVRLSKETLTQLSALALPGESIASVIQRAALALQTLENRAQFAESEHQSIEQRLEVLETRIERVEHCCGAYQASQRPDGDRRLR